MNFHKEKNVSIEIMGPSSRVLTCSSSEGKSHDTVIGFDSLDDSVDQSPTSFFNTTRTFNLIKVGHQHDTSTDTFVLRSELSKEYLSFDRDDRRRLVLQPVKDSLAPKELSSEFRFSFQEQHQTDFSDVGAPALIAAADGGKVKSPGQEDEELSLFVRFLRDQVGQPSIDASWKMQSSVITALGEPPDEDDDGDYFATGGEDEFERDEGIAMGNQRRVATVMGKGGTTPDNGPYIKQVKEMKSKMIGDKTELELAIEMLSEQKSDTSENVAVESDKVIRAAKLMNIMNDCVYLRDVEREKAIYMELQPYREEILRSMKRSDPISLSTRNKMLQVQEKYPDRVTEKIQQVADEMGLEYRPLCNFSYNGAFKGTGPYCGAFHTPVKQKSPTPIVVVAFKGTGNFWEWWNNLKAWMTTKGEVEKSSTLKGRVHTGFFNGIFGQFDFPGDVSPEGVIRNVQPFGMLRHQLLNLEDHLVDRSKKMRIQTWTTGHSLGAAYATLSWCGLLSGASFAQTTFRGVTTFGSPRVGDGVFASFARGLKSFRKSWRFANSWDFVTWFPRAWWVGSRGDWAHVDSLVVTSDREISLGKSEVPAQARLRKMMMVTEEASADGFIDEDDEEEGKKIVEAKGVDLAKFHKLLTYLDCLKTGVVAPPKIWP